MARRTKKFTKSASCTGKKRLTKAAALDLKRLLASTEAARMNAYRCRFCHLDDGSHAWHVGHRR